ncbi:endo alpha-1,4 polygalactosaminidase [Burkholderia arboris]|uniref:Endo alpha-1,4 polygalactosaminidase n=2 Tax=Burkholderia arboris TaxID=488730 RepID=A0A9Q9SQT1_9BURK|nr:endo alpha-1,4 polygalactosaminidase [Burkholderia arboris]VWC39795.1 endo alpha-1,4 polygalactosaminidase [Burkholderia arboris]
MATLHLFNVNPEIHPMKIARSLSVVAVMLLSIASLQGCGDGASSAPSAQALAAQSHVAAAAPASARVRWVPVASDTWQWQLRGTINTSYDVSIYDIDLFDVDPATIASLKNAGRKVVCYFSAGSSESWRSDFAKFEASDMGKKMEGWKRENWLDIRSENVRKIMQARLDRAVEKGCDGVEPDNVDGYANKTGFPLTSDDQYAYNEFLASEAHLRNLAVALKNDVDQLNRLEPSFDFAVNEQCNEHGECGKYSVFTSKNKPVLNAEYASQYHTPDGQRTLCDAASANNLRTMVLALELNDTYRFSCDK